MNIGNIELMIQNLLGVDDSRRTEAEQQITELENQPEMYLSCMIGVLRSSTHSPYRNLASILIRQKLNCSDSGLWSKLSPEFQSSFKQELISLLETEKELPVRDKICQSIGELGINLLESGNVWPELLPCLFAFTQSLDPATRLSGISILHYLTPYFVNLDRDDFPNLLGIFQQSLREHDHPLIQIEACRTVCSLLSQLQTSETLQFIILIPLILRALGDMLNHNRVGFAGEIIKALSDLVEVHPTFFKQNLESLIQAMVSIARPRTMDEDTRQSALEFLTLLIENSPVMIRALPAPTLVIPLLHILFSLLVDIPEEPDWVQAVDEPDESDLGLFTYVLNVFSRVSNTIRGRVLLPPFYQVIEEYMRNEDWRYRHAVMFAISQVAEVITDRQQRQQICDYVISSFQDPHPRVRYASVRCLGQLATDFMPFIQEELSITALNAIFSLLDISQPVRVRFITAAALSNFVDGSSPTLLQPVLKDMMEALMAPLQASPIIVQQQIMFAIASIADCVGDLFTPFYSLVMPIIKQLYIQPPFTAQDVTDPTIRTIYRSNALDCITCVGIAVGSGLFKNDARDILQVMYKEGMGEIETDSSDMKIYMMTAWGRMCTALKEDFIPYLDTIVPILIKTASKEVEIPDEEEEFSDYFEDMDDDSIDDDGIRTNAMDEKATACRVLSIFVDDLHAHLAPYLSDIMHTLLPLLNTSPFQDIQFASLAMMPEILVAIADTVVDVNGVATYRQSFIFILDILLKFIVDETELDLLIPALQTLDFCMKRSVLVKDTTIPILEGQEVSQIIEILRDTLHNSYERRAIRSANVELADWDEEEVEEFQEIESNENKANFWIAEIIGELLNGHSTFALPLLHDIMLNDLIDLSDASRTAGDRVVAIHVMVKIIEHCGRDAYGYYSQFIPIFMREIHSSDATIREEVLQGLSAAIREGKDLVCEVASKCIKEIEVMLDDPVSRESCYRNATLYGIKVIGELCCYLGNYLLLLSDHYVYWISHLPILADESINNSCMDLVCQLLERGDIKFIGETSQNIAQILRVLCESICLTSDTTLLNRMVRLVKSIDMQYNNPELMNSLWMNLGEEKEKLVKEKLNDVHLLV